MTEKVKLGCMSDGNFAALTSMRFTLDMHRDGVGFEGIYLEVYFTTTGHSVYAGVRCWSLS